MARCGIVPSFVLQGLAKHPHPDVARGAIETLELTHELAQGRSRPAPHPPSGDGRTICDAGQHRKLPGTIVRREGHPPSADPAVNQAYENAGITFSFFDACFDRRSVDGHGMRIVSSVHYAKRFGNAFWDGAQMVYGDGDGHVFGPFTAVLDVIAHEVTHGVTQMSSGLLYEGEPGALNESISDVFGSMAKQWHHRQTAERADWLIGEGLFKDRSVATALRSLKAPGTAYDSVVMGGKDPQPSHFRHYYRGRADHGGVHINSGIPNHAFYVLATSLDGYSWERAGRIWYESLTSDIGERCTFSHFAERTIATARRLFDRSVERRTRDAWRHVGVPIGT